ncbi:ABC transporter permease [Bacillus xiapuensis]|uniref:ABC transporter permease n=1 Tax=Bacillus xiapuensis TaxID=2014075 RepID=UPI000C23D55A|nr:ABC transporter permease [Bacillus xiapuensis]
MRKSWAICCIEVKKVFQKPSSYIVMFAMPLLFTVLFGHVFGEKEQQKPQLALVDQQKSDISSSIFHELQANDLFTVEQTTLAVAKERMNSHDVSGILVIEKKEAPSILFHHDPALTSAAAIIQSVEESVSAVQIQAAAARIWQEETGKKRAPDSFAKETAAAVKVMDLKEQKHSSGMTGRTQSAAGFSIMFVMIMMMTATGTIIEARSTGVWYRLLLAPTSKWQLMTGYLLAFFLIGWIQFAVLILSAVLLFDVSWGNPLGVAVLTSALLLCIIGLGLFIASLVKTAEQQAAIGSLVIVSTCMLSGIYWPLSIVPEFMQKIADFVPQTWAMKGYESLIVQGGHLADIALPVTILFIFAGGFLTAGIMRVAYD